MTQTQWQLDGGLGLDHLAQKPCHPIDPGPDEVRVRMTALSLNFRDTLIVHGMYGGKQPLPLIPLSDGAGVVEAVGENVRDLKIGDRVSSVFHQGWQAGPPDRERLSHALGAGETPGLASYWRVFPALGLVKTPDYLSDLEAATLPCAALTAWAALVEDCPAKPGESVLIEGTGGVSIFALQIAHAMGLRTLITSSSDEKLERARALGADETINYKTNPQWSKNVRDLTDGRGVDHVIEVGGAGTLEQALRSIRIGGRIASIGVLSGIKTDLTLPLLFMQHAQLQGISVGSRDMQINMNRFFSHHQIRPVLDDRIFSYPELPQSYQHMISRKHFGKIAISID